MKAIVIEQFGGPEKLEIQDIAKPIPEDNEILIQVAYAGVNPVDWKIREGYLKTRIPHEFPIILGWDVAGTVVEIGKRVKEFKIGDEVYAYVRKPLVKWGAYAEYVTFDAKDIAKKPKNISMAQAASLPLASLTAWQSIFDVAKLQKGNTILIAGGSGGVGSMGIQFAKQAGATVLTTASPKKQEYVKKLGADLVLDYHGDFVSAVKKYAKNGVDILFDCVGGETEKQSLTCIKKGGKFVSILEQISPAEAKSLGIEAHYVFVSPNGKELKHLAELIEQKKVIPPHIEEMHLEEAGQAQEKLRTGKVFGKIVLKVQS